ncbi:hypothetical protein [Pseudomonas sp. LFM046]|uniref:hypothetical protein n=1 Tax=Pseudomonas sp. LFM046 TaxID=1608357 RepID=UPI000698FD72|nr:hypothetical protein [Pseudomonas sp. LFM046]
MIKKIEEVLQHWGEKCRRAGVGGGLGSTLGAVMQWQGTPPRTGYGSKTLLGGGGVDLAASEVDAVLAELGRQGERQDQRLAQAWAAAGRSGRPPFCLDTQLVLLAKVRYLTDPMPLVEQQMRRVKIDGRRTYDLRVHQLHERIRDGLKARAEARAA